MRLYRKATIVNFIVQVLYFLLSAYVFGPTQIMLHVTTVVVGSSFCAHKLKQHYLVSWWKLLMAWSLFVIVICSFFAVYFWLIDLAAIAINGDKFLWNFVWPSELLIISFFIGMAVEVGVTFWRKHREWLENNVVARLR